MSIYYSSINSYLVDCLSKTDSARIILEIGAANDSKYLLNQSNITIVRSNLDKSLNNVSHFPADRIPYDDNYFDMVFMVAVDYLINDLEKSIIEITRVLKPHGRIIIFSYKNKVINRLLKMNYCLSDIYYKFVESGKLIYSENHIENFYNRGKIRNMFYNILPRLARKYRSPWLVRILNKS